jgi:hypothetical protein
MLLVVVLVAVGFQSTGVGGAMAAGLPGPAVPWCSWLYHPTVLTNNTGFVDTDASYWAMSYTVQDGLSIVLKGTYENARYEALMIYDQDTETFRVNGVFSALRDYQITPDPGSTNPWMKTAGAGGHYTLTINSKAPDGTPNQLPIAPAGTASGATGWLFLRVYRPAAGAASVHPPNVTFQRNGKSVSVPGCRKSATAVGARRLAATPAVMAPARAGLRSRAVITKQFARNSTETNSGWANPDNGYLTAGTNAPGGANVVVMRGKAPTVPAGDHPAPWPSSAQVRFWSACVYTPLPLWSLVSNTLADGSRDYGCRHDESTTLDSSGYYTFVLGTEAQRSAIEAVPGVTFLPFSMRFPRMTHTIMLRNLVANFPEAVQAAPIGSDSATAEKAMGAYFPHLAVCALSALASGGPRACIPTPAAR